MSNLHIVIYSELKQYGGGRETWLSYFLPGVFNHFESLNIYALKKKENNEKNLVELSGLNINCFFTEEISFIKFIKSTKNELKNNIKSGDICLMIGSIVEGSISPWLKRNFSDEVKRVIWVRSIAAHEVANRHGRITYPIIAFLEKRFLSSSNVVITNGDDTYNYYFNYWKKNTNTSMIAIPNAVDCEKYKCLRHWDEVRVVKGVFIGRFEPEKGGKNLLECISFFNDTYPELSDSFKVEIWGKGSLSQEKMPPNVRYCGKAERNEIASILSDSHIEFFLVNQNDNASGGLSHSLLEGLSSGCICVCSDISAYNQVISDKNGFLINLTDTREFACVISKMILDLQNHNYNRYLEISQSAVTTAQQYSVERHIEKFINVIGIKNENL